MITKMSHKNIINYILLLSSINYIHYVKADNQCTSNLDCAKLNTEVDTYVCIRWDGQKDFVCYLESEAYCDTDATCQGYNQALKFCYVPPWITNKNSQKQCFTVHSEGGTCLQDTHCSKGLVCNNNVCSAGGTTTTNNNNNANTENTTNNTNGNENTNNNTTKKTNTKTSNNSNSNNNSTSTIDLDYDDENKKDEPIEIIGLPLWGFIVVVTVPFIFLIVILWGLSIGRRSYREEEERKKNKLVLKNNKKDLDTNYKGASSEKLLPDSTSDYKNDMMKSYLNGGSGAVTSVSSSSNSTIANNLTAVSPALNNKSSQASLEPPKLRKNKKSNSNLSVAASSNGVPSKPKKPKSIVNSEYSDTNSQKGLLTVGAGAGMSAADSGVYSSYFGGGASSTVSSSYFGQGIPADPMNAYYYQQMMAAQQLQAQQLQAQTLMNQYYMNDPNMAAMPTVDMMQYQQLYGAGMMNGAMMNNQMLYQAGAGTTETTAPKKTKHKK